MTASAQLVPPQPLVDRSKICLTQPESRGSNWIHPSLEVRETRACRYGVFVREPIPAGTTVVVYGGVVITEAEFNALPEDLQHFPFNIADGLFLAPRDMNDIGVGERINHSCDPNAGFSGQINLCALRDIKRGEEVTFDYATCVASDGGAFVLNCECGAPTCRSVVTGRDWMLPDVQKRLFANFQPFLQEKVRGVEVAGFYERAQNSDRVQGLELHGRRFLAAVVSLQRSIIGFVVTALTTEWMAVPICVLAGIPSTIITVLLMTIIGPLAKDSFLFMSDTGFIAGFSLMTSVVGYLTYVSLYYMGMLCKERKDWRPNGRVDKAALHQKFRIIKYDFIAHLPSDLWVMPMIGAAQGGLMLAGSSQMWAIVIAHTLSDVAYAIKEPLYWHGAKQVVMWRDRVRSNA